MDRRSFLVAAISSAAVAALPKMADAAVPLLGRFPSARFYEVCGNTHFPIYGTNGAPRALAALFPFFMLDDDNRIIYQHRYSLWDIYGGKTTHEDQERLAMKDFAEKLALGVSPRVIGPGDNFPEPGEIVCMRER